LGRHTKTKGMVVIQLVRHRRIEVQVSSLMLSSE
jgi:hypothetical protein